MARKNHSVEIYKNGEIVHAYTAEGGAKSKHRQYMLAAMSTADQFGVYGETVEIRYQIVGARKFARYAYAINTETAHYLGAA